MLFQTGSAVWSRRNVKTESAARVRCVHNCGEAQLGGPEEIVQRSEGIWPE